jgi:enoyl-CoA hydratase/carnithine racemase
MPRDGSLILSDVRGPTLAIVCEPCGRRGRYNVDRLMTEHRALEVLLAADDIKGELAELYGYVNRAFPDAELNSG